MSGDNPVVGTTHGAPAAGATAWSAGTDSTSGPVRAAGADRAVPTQVATTDAATNDAATNDLATNDSATNDSATNDSATNESGGGAQPVRRGAHSAGASARGGNDVSVATEEAEEYVDPKVGPSDLSRLPGPFTTRQLARIDEALSLATEETGLLFSLYVGELGTPTRAAAEVLAGELPSRPEQASVLLAVSPGQRVLHIVTSGDAVRRLPNRVCALAALSMRAAFAGGDLTAGAVNGLRMLADAAGHYSGSHLPPPAATTGVASRRH